MGRRACWKFVENMVTLNLHTCLNSRYACDVRLGSYVAAHRFGLESIGKACAITDKHSGQGHATRHAIIFNCVWLAATRREQHGKNDRGRPHPKIFPFHQARAQRRMYLSQQRTLIKLHYILTSCQLDFARFKITITPNTLLYFVLILRKRMEVPHRTLRRQKMTRKLRQRLIHQSHNHDGQRT